MRKSAVLALLLLLSIGFARANEIRPGDVVRAIALPSGTLYLQAEGTSREQSVTAVILRDATHTIVLQPFECLPADVRPASGRGQVFGGAELESGELLLPIGWSNPSGRNINGIAVLDGSTYDCKRVIILPGSVRDIAPLSGRSAAVVLTHLTGKENAIEIAVIESSGEVRAATRYHSDTNIEDIEQLALQLRLHRIDTNAFSVSNLRREVIFRYEFDSGEKTCKSAVKTHRADGLVYPVLGKPCGTVALKRMAAFGATPGRMQDMTRISVIDAFFRPDGSEVVVRSGFEKQGPKTWVTIYGASAEEIEVPERLIPPTISVENHAIHGLVLIDSKPVEKTIKLP